MLSEFRIPPLAELLSGNFGEVRPQRQQIPHGIGRCLWFAQLSIGRRKCEAGTPERRHIHLKGEVYRSLVVLPSIGVEGIWEPIPPRMMGVELSGASYQPAAALPSPGIRQQ